MRTFIESLGLDQPLEFNQELGNTRKRLKVLSHSFTTSCTVLGPPPQGDVGVAGGMQITEPASEHVVLKAQPACCIFSHVSLDPCLQLSRRTPSCDSVDPALPSCSGQKRPSTVRGLFQCPCNVLAICLGGSLPEAETGRSSRRLSPWRGRHLRQSQSLDLLRALPQRLCAPLCRYCSHCSAHYGMQLCTSLLFVILKHCRACCCSFEVVQTGQRDIAQLLAHEPMLIFKDAHALEIGISMPVSCWSGPL